MSARVFSATLIGLDAKIIEVEVDIARGERKINIVGLAEKAVQEAKDRMRAAFRSCEIELGPGYKVINLAPADIPKTTPSYDLPMAVGLSVACGKVRSFYSGDKVFIGELALDGSVRPVHGVLAIAYSCFRQGFSEIYVPEANAAEAGCVKGLRVIPVKNLGELIEGINGDCLQTYVRVQKTTSGHEEPAYDMKDIKGQESAKRALEIAAAGGHNILLSGVPGAGKTFLARSFASILPNLGFDESIEVTRIYSVAGLIDPSAPLITTRPFRSPHHTASQIALVGGGSVPRPGEITLAHRGVLFLDELTEFESKTLEVLRQPIEDKVVHIARAAATVSFPSNFQLIAAMNPCKCGYAGDFSRQCVCTEYDKIKYRRKISGPILDRIDMQVNVPKVNRKLLTANTRQESSYDIRERVIAARNIQKERFGSIESPTLLNSEMNVREIKKFIRLDTSSKSLLQEAIGLYNLSARAYFRVLKLARTIADLSHETSVSEKHIAEALNFRLSVISYSTGG